MQMTKYVKISAPQLENSTILCPTPLDQLNWDMLSAFFIKKCPQASNSISFTKDNLIVDSQQSFENMKQLSLQDDQKVIKLIYNQIEAQQEEAKQQCDQIHHNYVCDGCREQPIIGIRYRCYVCSDVDFCEKCEQKNLHVQHPLIKIRNQQQAELTKNKLVLVYQDKIVPKFQQVGSSINKTYHTAKEWIIENNTKVQVKLQEQVRSYKTKREVQRKQKLLGSLFDKNNSVFKNLVNDHLDWNDEQLTEYVFNHPQEFMINQPQQQQQHQEQQEHQEQVDELNLEQEQGVQNDNNPQ